MSTLTKTSSLAAAVTALSLCSTPSGTARAEPAVHCALSSRASCDISEPYGIKRVVVKRRNALGLVKAIDKTYACVPATSVKWTPAERAAELTVTPCDDPDARDYQSFGRIQETPFLNRRFELSFSDTNGDGQDDTIDVRYARFAQMGFAIDPGTSELEDLTCDHEGVCDSMAAFCDEHAGVGTCYEDHCECDLP